LSVSGSVSLLSDTSLVRIIVSDQEGVDWLVYEYYPLIASSDTVYFTEICDETCYLNAYVPFSLEIQVYESFLTIDEVTLYNTYHSNAETLQFQEKMNNEAVKVTSMNEYIDIRGWNWQAGITELATMFYSKKSKLFGRAYNLLGYDYYLEGIFKTAISDYIASDNSSLRRNFDWREKHDANQENSYYFDNDPDQEESGNGWLTGLRDQNGCGACSAFGSTAALELQLNLVYNQHVDVIHSLRLSERDAFNCSQYESNSPYVGCECDEEWGKNLTYVLNYIVQNGLVNEGCFQWEPPYCSGPLPDCSPENSGKCPDPDYIVTPAGKGFGYKSPHETLASRLKTCIIENGAVISIIEFRNGEDTTEHVLPIIGFETNAETGELSWICKDSYGLIGGYRYIAHSVLLEDMDGMYHFFSREIDIQTDPENEIILDTLDHDKDGYWNWGIGDKPDDLQTICGLEPIEDWNDNNNRIGNRDENYYGIPVKPEIRLFIGPEWSSQDRIRRDQYINFSGNANEPVNLHLTIENTGNAQLNLTEHSVTGNGKITLSNQNCFSVTDYPELAVCWAQDQNTTTFDILFSFTGMEEAITKVTVEIDEPDIEDFEFYLVYENCNEASGTEVIDQSYVLWDTDMLVTHDILITNRTELEITGALALLKNARITIEPESKLLLNGGSIGAACDGLWNGIKVHGDPELPQTSSYQGVVEITNGGVIQMARVGIQTLNSDNTPSGGVISCDDAMFLDNVIGVKMYPYTNTDMQGNPLPNFSSFRLCRFIFSDFIYDWPAETKQGLSLWGVDGLKIMGCEFINDATIDGTPVSNDATGIYSFNAGYWMNEECIDPTINPCPGTRLNSFEHLTYGIYAITDRPTKYISIDTASFTDCRTGIYMGAISTPKVIRCVFNSNTENSVFGSSDTTVGIYLEKCNQYFVEENTFTDHRETTQLSVGIHVLNSVPGYNEIYNNSFTGNYAGIVAAGENRDDLGEGLCIKCNRFTACNHDIYITAEGGSDPDRLGIAEKQGEANSGGSQYDNLAAGNIFSDYTGTEVNFTNNLECNPITYSHHNRVTTEFKIAPFPFDPPNQPLHLEFEEDLQATFSLDESCPSHLGGSGINPMVEQLNISSEMITISQYEDTLAQRTDGGDTYGLNFDVQSSFPDEALVVRQQLIDESPYLSDTVMKTAIAKDDVLPNAMIRDVLVSNPQSAKSNEIVDMLYERIDPMPDYMMNEIMQGEDVLGAKELIEKNIAVHSTKKNRALSKLVRYYKMDTSIYGSYRDSVIDILSTDLALSATYNLASYYLDTDDSAQAFSLLDYIPYSYSLSPQDQQHYDDFYELFSYQWQGKDSLQIDSLAILSIQDFALSTLQLSGVYSRNILINQNSLTYIEPVYLPSSYKSVLSEAETILDPEQEQRDIKVFPNPAGTYFIIEYSIADNNDMQYTIRIIDVSGKPTYNLELHDSQNQLVVPTTSFSNGLHLVQLLYRGYLKESVKISISK